MDERDRGRAELRGELHDRGQRVDVVDQAGDEEQRGAAEDPEQLLVGVHAAGRRSRRAIPAASPRKMPTPPKVGVACSLQRSPRRVGTISRCASGERRSAQITKALTGRATAAAAALIAGQP